MDKLRFITNANDKLLGQLEQLGCDEETLLILSQPLFALTDQLGCSPWDAADLVYRLKLIADLKRGVRPVLELTLYENDKVAPSRLAVENYLTSATFYFARTQGGDRFCCELCEDVALPRDQVKSHVKDFHC